MYHFFYVFFFVAPFCIYIYILKVKCFLLKSDLSTRHRLYVQKTDGKIFGVVVNNFDQIALAGSSCYGSIYRQLSNKGIGSSVLPCKKQVPAKGARYSINSGGLGENDVVSKWEVGVPQK